MKEVTTYLNFDGNCRDAMTFYAKCLGADLHLMTMSETQPNVPPEAANRIMHASLTKGKPLLMASDTMPGMPFQQGANFAVCVDCENLEEIEKFFSAFGEKGKITMALQDTFWGARFGMITDQFGVNWMFNFELPKQA
jgi:PhnB protein